MHDIRRHRSHIRFAEMLNSEFKGVTDILKKRLLRNLNDYGLLIFIKKSFSYLLKPLYHKKSLILYKLNIQCPPSKKVVQNIFKFVLVTTDNKDYINQIESMEEWLKGSLKEQLSTNALCMAVIENNRVVGFNLATLGEAIIPLLKLRVIIPKEEAWSLQITIQKDYRRKGLGSLLRNNFYAELRMRNIKALYGHRQTWNIASKKSAKRYTANKIVLVEYVKILNIHRLYFSKYSSEKPRIGLKSDNVKFKLSTQKLFERNDYLFTIDMKHLKL